MISKKLTPSRLAIAGLILTVFGLFGIVPMLFNSDDVAIAASSSIAQVAGTPDEVKQQAPVAPTTISGHPVRIVAPTVGVDMPVVDGFYDSASGDWTLYPDKAQFAAMTAEPNDKEGQTFIYGHATHRVFGKLLTMKTGEQVEVYTSNGYKFTYTLTETDIVTPQNTNVLSYTGKPRLLLQTCVGAWSQNRKFFMLDFAKVDKL